MNYDYYKLYLKNQSNVYEDAKIYKNFDKLLNDLEKYYHNYKGCLVIARDKINDCDVLVCSREFNNENVVSKKTKIIDKINISIKVKKKHKKVKKKYKKITKKLIRRRR